MHIKSVSLGKKLIFHANWGFFQNYDYFHFIICCSSFPKIKFHDEFIFTRIVFLNFADEINIVNFISCSKFIWTKLNLKVKKKIKHYLKLQELCKVLSISQITEVLYYIISNKSSTIKIFTLNGREPRFRNILLWKYVCRVTHEIYYADGKKTGRSSGTLFWRCVDSLRMLMLLWILRFFNSSLFWCCWVILICILIEFKG